MRDVVSNTSPLLYLHQLGRLDLIRALYSRVLVPQSVVAELDVGRARGYDVPAVAEASWIEVVSSPGCRDPATVSTSWNAAG
jgi:predicted nucleic acid-binding protein